MGNTILAGMFVVNLVFAFFNKDAASGCGWVCALLMLYKAQTAEDKLNAKV